MRIPLRRLMDAYTPFDRPVWCESPVTENDVLRAIAEGRTMGWDELKDDSTVADHAARIAHLALHGWTDPIDIEHVGGHGTHGRRVVVHDGNHRLAAAIIRNDRSILASVSGYVDIARTEFAIHSRRRVLPRPRVAGVKT